MYPLPPVANPLFAGENCPWLPPVAFGEKPYRKLCRRFDRALAELEARFPSHQPMLTIEGRAKQLKHKPK